MNKRVSATASIYAARDSALQPNINPGLQDFVMDLLALDEVRRGDVGALFDAIFGVVTPKKFIEVSLE